MPVAFTDPKVELIIGPQLKIGEGGHTYLDQVQISKGVYHGTNFPAVPPTPQQDANSYMNAQYYDLGLCLYNLYYRSNDPAHLTLAKKVTDSWWNFAPIGAGTTAIESSLSPRNSSVGGLMMRALDGRPEMWDWIVKFVRFQFDSWVKRYLTEPELVNGVRDGSYMLLYAIWLAKVLPDSFPLTGGGTATNGAALRAGFLADAEQAAGDYYIRLQYPDGSFRWSDAYIQYEGGYLTGIMQPFMVGLLLHSLIDVYRVTTNTTLKDKIKSSVLLCVNHLYDGGPYMKRNAGIPNNTLRWRAFNYFYHGGTSVNPTRFINGDYDGINASTIYDVEGAREASGTLLHAFGWAYSVTQDPKYTAMADDLYDSIFGFKEDQVSDYVAGNDPKGYNQHFRACGRLLAWRTGVVTPPIDPPPTMPTIRKVSWPGTEGAQDQVIAQQWTERYRFKRNLSGKYAEFELVP